jgi:4a-hydroxytetrahydrobiopterin dehydratase
MSEQGWRDFLAVEDLDDWVVLHGRATAVFAVGSIHDAAGLADARSRRSRAWPARGRC